MLFFSYDSDFESEPKESNENNHRFRLDVNIFIYGENDCIHYEKSFIFFRRFCGDAIDEADEFISKMIGYFGFTRCANGVIRAFLYKDNDLQHFQSYDCKIEALQYDFDEIFNNGFFEER